MNSIINIITNFVSKNKIFFTTLSLFLLFLIQVVFSYQRAQQAAVFVSSLSGVQASSPRFEGPPNSPHGVNLYIKWDYSNYDPPHCPVTLAAIFEHVTTGFSLTDGGVFVISATEFAAIHRSKNGKLTIEPVMSAAIAHEMNIRRGLWGYSFVLKFHCSIVDSNWLKFLLFDKAYYSKPVRIRID